ncbi:MAG: GEVED domain-containing protein, partial [Bacteroidota bacterium]
MKAYFLRILFLFTACTIFSAHQLQAQYCASQSNISTDEHITDVTMGTLSNASGGSNYSDYTAQSATVNPGGNPQISVTIYNGAPPNVTWNEYVSVFIDWDQNQTFDTLTERYLVGSCNTNGCVVSGNISVPPTATPGTTRMRVILQYNDYRRDPCGNYQFGETEDYGLIVLP